MSCMYIEANLKPNENIIEIGKLHWIIYINIYTVCGVLILLLALWLYHSMYIGYLIVSHTAPLNSIGLLGIFLITYGMVVVLIEKLTTEYAITNIKIIKKVGLIRREVHEINISKIETVNINQSILGRLLGYGTIIISGTGTQFVVVKNIYNPLLFKLNIPNNV